MVNYNCPRCGYNTQNKPNIVRHLNRKNICKPTKFDIDVIKYKQDIIDGKKFVEKIPIPVPIPIATYVNEPVQHIPTIVVREDRSTTVSSSSDIETFIDESNEVLEFNNYESKLTKKLDKIFNNEEMSMFKASFVGYLHYDDETDFVVDFESVWRWVGYIGKYEAKRALLKNFEENKDFIISYEKLACQVGQSTLYENSFSDQGKNEGTILQRPRENKSEIENVFAPQACGAKTIENVLSAQCKNLEKTGETRGGYNKETILLTVLTFKKFCMMAGTKKAYKIHDYYIKMEKCLHQLLHEEILKKNRKIKGMKTIMRLKDKHTEQNLIFNFDDMRIVYICLVEKDVVKFGFTRDIRKRIKTHTREFGTSTVQLKYIFESVYNSEIEKLIKQDPRLKDRIFSKTYYPRPEKPQTELIRLDKNFTLENLREIFEDIKKKAREELVSKLVRDNTRLKLESTELKLRVSDLQLLLV
jgi:phage anti-repressor protein